MCKEFHSSHRCTYFLFLISAVKNYGKIFFSCKFLHDTLNFAPQPSKPKILLSDPLPKKCVSSAIIVIGELQVEEALK